MRIVSTMIAITLSMLFANSAGAEAPNDPAPVIRAVETNIQPASVIRVQSVNNPPHCDDWSIKLNAPSYATASGTVGFLHKCSDPDGDTLTVTSPGTTYNFVLNPGVWTLTIPFSVSDGRGGTASAVLTINR